jgi:hypothetical protein
MFTDILTIYTYDQYYRAWPIGDASGVTLENNENGYSQATWQLEREFDIAWEDIGINFQVFFFSPRGDTAWHGRIDTIEPSFGDDGVKVKCSAVGYWASTYDLPFNGVLGTSTTPEAMEALLVNSTYLPQLVTSTSGLITTGITGVGYQTPDSGVNDVRVGDVLLQLTRFGTSVTGQRVVPYVLTGRQLFTRALPATPTARYILRLGNTASVDLRRVLSAIGNRANIKWKDTVGNVNRTSVNDASSQNSLGVDFTGLGTITPFVRVQEVKDVTSYVNMTAAIATSMANASLYTTKQTRNDSQDVTIQQDWVIFDTVAGQEVPNWAVLAGYWIDVPDLFPRPQAAGSGSTGGDQALATLFYIKNAKFEQDTGYLTITPENSSDLSEVAA